MLIFAKVLVRNSGTQSHQIRNRFAIAYQRVSRIIAGFLQSNAVRKVKNPPNTKPEYCAVNCELRSSQKIRAKRNGYQLANQPTARTIAGLIGVKCAKTFCVLSSGWRLIARLILTGSILSPLNTSTKKATRLSNAWRRAGEE